MELKKGMKVKIIKPEEEEIDNSVWVSSTMDKFNGKIMTLLRKEGIYWTLKEDKGYKYIGKNKKFVFDEKCLLAFDKKVYV